MGKKALIIVDVQNDFCPGGALAVPKGDEVVPVINEIREKYADKLDLIVLTQDWHPEKHISFASTHGKDVFSTTEVSYGTQVMWPDHCVQGSIGAEFHSELARNDADVVVRKGFHVDIDSYSAFVENDKKTRTDLEKILHDHGVTDIFVTGLASDYCAGWTAIDGAHAGFSSFFIEDAARGIGPDSMANTAADMDAAGVNTIKSADLGRIISI